MFTGIVEELGKIQSIKKSSNSCIFKIVALNTTKDIQEGDSVAINGVCLTVAKLQGNIFEVDVMPETLRKTNLGLLKTGAMVNVESALRLSDRLGGHVVSGHVDGIGKIISKKREGNAINFKIKTSSKITSYFVPKGSVAIDGISLTVIDVSKDLFTAAIIPHTAKMTTLGFKKQGATVNIEIDLMGKYVKKFLGEQNKSINLETFANLISKKGG